MEKKGNVNDPPQPEPHHRHKNFAQYEEVPNTPTRPSLASLRSSSVTLFPNPRNDVTEMRDAISSHKLYISNLPEETTFGDLQDLFPKAISVVMDNRVMGSKTAVVEFESWQTCDEAFKARNHTQLQGQLLIISPKTSSY